MEVETAFLKLNASARLESVCGQTDYREAWYVGCGYSSYPDAGTPWSAGNKIIGGKDAMPYEFPWIGSLRWLPNAAYPEDHFCAVSLIHPRFAVTAAHCIRLRDPKDMVIIFGEYEPAAPSDVRQPVYLDKFIHHYDYDWDARYDSDIAVIKLMEDVVLSDYIWPVCAPEPGNLYLEAITQTSGWGTSVYGEWILPRVLQWISVPITNNDDCQWSIGDEYVVTDNMICAGEMFEDERDACQGDSGGPLTTKRGDRFELIGITSWGRGCAFGSPGIYTRVSKFVDWVSQQIAIM